MTDADGRSVGVVLPFWGVDEEEGGGGGGAAEVEFLREGERKSNGLRDESEALGVVWSCGPDTPPKNPLSILGWRGRERRGDGRGTRRRDGG